MGFTTSPCICIYIDLCIRYVCYFGEINMLCYVMLLNIFRPKKIYIYFSFYDIFVCVSWLQKPSCYQPVYRYIQLMFWAPIALLFTVFGSHSTRVNSLWAPVAYGLAHLFTVCVPPCLQTREGRSHHVVCADNTWTAHFHVLGRTHWPAHRVGTK